MAKVKKLSQKQKRAQRKRVIGIVVAVLVVALVGTGVYKYHKNHTKSQVTAQSQSAIAGLPPQAESEAIFKQYLVKAIDSKKSYSEDSYSGTGSKMTAKMFVDATNKHVMASVDLDCSAHVNTMDVILKASLQQENAVTYIRLNSIAGTVTNANGQSQYLSDVYSKVKGNWYKASEADIAIQAQLDSGVFIYDSGIMAPGHDTQQIVSALMSNHIYEHALQKRDGNNYVFSVHADQLSFSGPLQTLFPSLNSPDEVLSSLFSTGGTLDSTLTVAKDGTLIKQETTHDNLCKSVMASFTGVAATSVDAPTILTGTSIPKPLSDNTITPVANTKPADGLKNDLLY